MSLTVTDQPGGQSKVSCTVFRGGRPQPAPTSLADISEILKDDGTLVWFDLVDPGPNDLTVLQEEFDLHPLAVEDAVAVHERPKIEAYGSYWFLVVQGTTVAGERVAFHEVAIFASDRFVVTVRHDPTYPLEEIRHRWEAHNQEVGKGGGFLLYTILDTIVDGYLPVAEAFQARVDDIEEMLFRKERIPTDVLPAIFQMKKDAQRFRWAVLPMRDILNPILRRDLPLFPEEELAYFRDVYDHAVRVIDQLDTLRDLVNSALEIHLSVVANRQNEVSKQLTIIATIFLPLSFITGFFGQNFGYLVNDIQNTREAFWILGLGTEAVAVVLMFLYFRWKGWF